MAELFHHYHRALVPDFGCTSKPDAEVWEQIPHQEKIVWWLLPVWHYWNWPQRPESGKTQDAISQSRVKLNGVADTGIRCSRNYEMRKLT
jgi:hypothetical protein